ncbi:MAG: flavodoxin family protein [Spirillospora sp.]
MDEPIRVLAISCSPSIGGKTRAALEAVLAGAVGAGAETTLLELAEDDSPDQAQVVAAMAQADAYVFGSPMYRAGYTAQFKALLDVTPRGMYGEKDALLTGHAVLTVATAASEHHMLGPAAMRDVLVDFFAAHVVSPGLYLTADDYGEGALKASPAERASVMGLALVELAAAIRSSTGLRAVVPNA